MLKSMKLWVDYKWKRSSSPCDEGTVPKTQAALPRCNATLSVASGTAMTAVQQWQTQCTTSKITEKGGCFIAISLNKNVLSMPNWINRLTRNLLKFLNSKHLNFNVRSTGLINIATFLDPDQQTPNAFWVWVSNRQQSGTYVRREIMPPSLPWPQ